MKRSDYLNIFGIITIAIIIIIIMTIFQTQIWNSLISTGGTITKEDWLKESKSYALYIIITAFILSLVFYIRTRFMVKFEKPQIKNLRPFWLFLSFPVFILSLITYYFFPNMSYLLLLVYLLLNGVLCYYVSTLIFAPAKVRTIPIGADRKNIILIFSICIFLLVSILPIFIFT